MGAHNQTERKKLAIVRMHADRGSDSPPVIEISCYDFPKDMAQKYLRDFASTHEFPLRGGGVLGAGRGGYSALYDNKATEGEGFYQACDVALNEQTKMPAVFQIDVLSGKVLRLATDPLPQFHPLGGNKGELEYREHSFDKRDGHSFEGSRSLNAPSVLDENHKLHRISFGENGDVSQLNMWAKRGIQAIRIHPKGSSENLPNGQQKIYDAELEEDRIKSVDIRGHDGLVQTIDADKMAPHQKTEAAELIQKAKAEHTPLKTPKIDDKTMAGLLRAIADHGERRSWVTDDIACYDGDAKMELFGYPQKNVPRALMEDHFLPNITQHIHDKMSFFVVDADQLLRHFPGLAAAGKVLDPVETVLEEVPVLNRQTRQRTIVQISKPMV